MHRRQIRSCSVVAFPKLYFFAGSRYWRYDVSADAVDPGWPKEIDVEWRRMPDRVGDTVNFGNGKAYFFLGREYRRFDLALDRVDVGPLGTAKFWPGVPDLEIDAAVRVGNGDFCFFHGKTCSRFSAKENHTLDGYPRRIADDWPGMPDAPVDAAVNYDNGSIYFFVADRRYTRFHLKANRVAQPFESIAANWHGLPDGRVDGVVEWSDADLRAACAPIYDPSFWNDSGRGIRVDNNCYNYACNRVLPTGFANPGRGGFGHAILIETCAQLDAGLRVDGLVRTDPDHPDCSGCRHQIMMVKGYREDYHFYRRDRDGMWSHKVGHEPATNLDSSGRTITDPRTANRAQFTEFCGSYCVDRSALRIA